MSNDHVSQLLTVGFSESQLHLAFLVLLWANLIFFPQANHINFAESVTLVNQQDNEKDQ
jgi:hypothetical protein